MNMPLALYKCFIKGALDYLCPDTYIPFYHPGNAHTASASPANTIIPNNVNYLHVIQMFFFSILKMNHI